MDRKWIAPWVGLLLWSALAALPLRSAVAQADTDIVPSAKPSSDDYWPRVVATLEESTQLRDRALAAQLRVLQAHILNRIADNPSASPIRPAQVAGVHLLLPELARSDDPLALSLALQAGISSADKAVVAAASERWKKLEPDNLAPILWIGQTPDKTLEAARSTTRYDSRSYEQIRFMMEVFQRVPMNRTEIGEGYREVGDTDEARAALNAFSLWAAYGIPAFQDVVNACRDQTLHAVVRRPADCRHVAAVLANESDVLIAQGIGIAMLKRTASSAEEQAQAQALKRDMDWQLHQRYLSGADSQALRDDVTSMLRLLRSPGINSERQMSEAILSERGIALTPPADWQAPNTN